MLWLRGVVNDQNEILLTLRSPDKEKYPGTWENTGGALEAGEGKQGGSGKGAV